MKTKMAWLCTTLLTLHLLALAADYTGTFQGDQLTLSLTASAERYSGTIQLGDKKLPCTGRETDRQLKGTFESEGDQFPFTATL